MNRFALAALIFFLTGTCFAQVPEAAPPEQQGAPEESKSEDDLPAEEKSAEEPSPAPEESGSTETVPPPSFPVAAAQGQETAPEQETAPPSESTIDTYADSSLEPPPGEKAPVPLFLFGVLWDHSYPLANSRDLVRKYSLSGFSIEGRYRGLGNLGLGFRLGWDTMSEKAESTFTRDALTVSGTQIRTLFLSPMLLTVSYALRDSRTESPKGPSVVPYVLLGAGGGRALRQLDLGISTYLDESWHFALAPELGVEIPTKFLVLMAGARLHSFIKTKDAPGQLALSFSFGLGFD